MHNNLRSEASLLSKSSCLVPALFGTNLLMSEVSFWSHFSVLPKSDLDAQQTNLLLITIIVVNLVTLKAAAKLELLLNKPASWGWQIEVLCQT
jgi:hypothetical protein